MNQQSNSHSQSKETGATETSTAESNVKNVETVSGNQCFQQTSSGIMQTQQRQVPEINVRDASSAVSKEHQSLHKIQQTSSEPSNHISNSKIYRSFAPSLTVNSDLKPVASVVKRAPANLSIKPKTTISEPSIQLTSPRSFPSNDTAVDLLLRQSNASPAPQNMEKDPLLSEIETPKISITENYGKNVAKWERMERNALFVSKAQSHSSKLSIRAFYVKQQKRLQQIISKPGEEFDAISQSKRFAVLKQLRRNLHGFRRSFSYTFAEILSDIDHSTPSRPNEKNSLSELDLNILSEQYNGLQISNPRSNKVDSEISTNETLVHYQVLQSPRIKETGEWEANLFNFISPTIGGDDLLQQQNSIDFSRRQIFSFAQKFPCFMEAKKRSRGAEDAESNDSDTKTSSVQTDKQIRTSTVKVNDDNCEILKSKFLRSISTDTLSRATSPTIIDNNKTTLVNDEHSPITSTSVNICIGTDDIILNLTDLESVFGADNLPPITRKSLRELELENIINNPQLRHDMIFDNNLEFRPNDSGERGKKKREHADKFWAEIELYFTDTGARCIKIPVIINEIKEIMMDLVSSEDYRRSIDINIDTLLIAQQLQHGVSVNVGGLMEFIVDILKQHCAPIRDKSIDKLLIECSEGNFPKVLRMCFEVLEQMKLDVANDQLRRLRPYVLQNAIEYEWQVFKERLQTQAVGLYSTVKWLGDFVDDYGKNKENSILGHPCNSFAVNQSFSELFYRACLFLIDKNGLVQDIPETFAMDANRITSYQNEWQDLTIMSCLLTLFKQCSGNKCTSDELLEMKRQLWVLLNDNETTMANINIHLVTNCNKYRPNPMSEKEISLFSSMVDKTLLPDSRVYLLIHQRIGDQLLWYLKTRSLNDSNETLIKHGLYELSQEIRDLGERIRFLIEHNKAVYHKVYDQILVKRK